jgi:hypothetical protein
VTRSTVRAGCLLTAALLFVACGTDTTSPSVAPTTSLVPPASGRPAPSGSGSIDIDETLIDHLPAEVEGIRLTGDPDTAGTIASDPDLATNVSAIAVAFAIAPGTSVADDLAVVSVVRLRPGVFDAAFFRSWRDSYDAAACEAAGGMTGNAEAEIAGRHTFIGSCAAGAHTYHVYLEAPGVIVSVTSVGDRRLGEQIVAGLRE